MTALARFPIIVGPTAGGKSDLAVHVAQRLSSSTADHAILPHRGRCLARSASEAEGAPPSSSPTHALSSSRLPTPDSRPPFSSEIITADAFQIFRGLDIGTAKPSLSDRAGIPHHLIDIVDPRDRFSVHDWLTLANQTIADIQSRGHTPIVVGGTHLYIKALLDGLFEGPGPDPALRAALSAQPPADLRAELERIDPATAARLHPNDLRRTVRAIEVFHLTGKPISAHQQQWDRAPSTGGAGFGTMSLPPASSTPAMNESSSEIAGSSNPSLTTSGSSLSSRLLIGLDWPAELLNPRINARVRAMLDRGLIDEVRALWKSGAFDPPLPGSAGRGAAARGGGEGLPPLQPSLIASSTVTPPSTPSLSSSNQSREALGYKQLIEHFEGRCSLDDAIEKIKIETRRFAKNQRTWLKRLRTTPNSIWIDAATTPAEDWPAIVLRACSSPPPSHA